MHRQVPLDRIQSLSSDLGLDETQIESRSRQYGSNDIIETHSNVWLELIENTAKDPMIWFLVGASVLYAILQEYHESIVLLVATIPLIGMDVFLHWRTQASTQSQEQFGNQCTRYPRRK
jgi:Ca2+-transporting ATPase